MNQPSRATRLIHTGEPSRPMPRTVGPPVHKGSTVLLPDAAYLYDHQAITYGRGGLTTHEVLSDALAELEGAAKVKLFPSGLAALTGAMLAVLKCGDDVLVTDAIYKPTRRFCDHVLKRFGVGVRFYPARATARELMGMSRPSTRLIVMESPGSLTFEMQDVRAIAAAARGRGILTLLDNTWAAGWYFKPLDHGVDISVQSLTKYVGGHADVFMGAAATCDPDLGAALEQAIWDLGWSVAADDAYQILRGLRTLPTRMERHQKSALRVAGWLEQASWVQDVLWPALPSSIDHELWRRDYAGAAGLFGVVLRPSPTNAVERFLNSLKIFGLGFSWGGFESLALDGGPQLGVREFTPGFAGPLVRLNIGLEEPDDLIDDLRQAFKAMDVAP